MNLEPLFFFVMFPVDPKKVSGIERAEEIVDARVRSTSDLI